MINRFKASSFSEHEVGATVGYKLESFTKNKITFNVIDMSGQGKYRSLWEKYYDQADAIIFVVDASDQLRFGVAKNELDIILENECKYDSLF